MTICVVFSLKKGNKQQIYGLKYNDWKTLHSRPAVDPQV